MSAFAFTTDGFPDGSGTNAVNQNRQVERLYCTAAVTAGDWIAEYASDTTNPAGKTGESYRTADADNADAVWGTVGVAAETTTAAGYATVYVRGRVTGANVDSGAAVAIGDDLSIGSTAGRAIEYTGTNPNLRVIARCLSTPSSNTADVEIYPHPKFA